MSRQRSSHSTTWPRLEPSSAETSLLTEGQVRRLRDARSDGVPIKVLAQRFGVSKELVTALTAARPSRCPCCKRDLGKLPHAKTCQPWALARRIGA